MSFKGSRRWGHLTLVREYRGEVRSPDDGYVIDTHGPNIFELRCECGNQWSVLESVFPGKRYMKSCRREGCPYTARERAKRTLADDFVNQTYYMPREIAKWVEKKASDRKVNKSAYIRDLLKSKMMEDFINE